MCGHHTATGLTHPVPYDLRVAAAVGHGIARTTVADYSLVATARAHRGIMTGLASHQLTRFGREATVDTTINRIIMTKEFKYFYKTKLGARQNSNTKRRARLFIKISTRIKPQRNISKVSSFNVLDARLLFLRLSFTIRNIILHAMSL